MAYFRIKNRSNSLNLILPINNFSRFYQNWKLQDRIELKIRFILLKTEYSHTRMIFFSLLSWYFFSDKNCKTKYRKSKITFIPCFLLRVVYAVKIVFLFYVVVNILVACDNFTANRKNIKLRTSWNSASSESVCAGRYNMEIRDSFNRFPAGYSRRKFWCVSWNLNSSEILFTVGRCHNSAW